MLTTGAVQVEEIETYSRHTGQFERELLELSKDTPAVQLLPTISGVGLRTSEAVVVFIDDPHCFPDSERIDCASGRMTGE